ncbi:hypothetical protein NRB_51070 [Novosphingobium sp. 11B]
MKYIAIAALALLSGCASTQTVLSQPPRDLVNSTTSQANVAFCIANKNNVPALDAPDGAKVIQIKKGYGAVGMIFSVYADGAWSRIEVRKPIGVSLAAHRQCY